MSGASDSAYVQIKLLKKLSSSTPIKTSSPVQSPVNKLNNANANNSNYQNQITTNGGSSLANSQPTPESSQLPELPHSPAPQLEKPSAEEVARAAIEAAVANGITSITTNKVVETTEPSSPNANSVAATATATAATTVKTEETIREVIADAKETTTTTTTTTTTATKTVNGNNNEEEATAAAINNSSSNSNSSTSAPASSTAKEPGKQPKELPDGQSGANGNSSSLEEHKQKKLDTETVVSSSHQKQLVNSQTVNKHNKNPFDDDDERIYEVPKGE
ncbi:uncharacterized protein LOC117566716 [Drosophila albomicans]|uniref:Uncharacterized protein LOC117566716 n=1 Tax=Drosophila albomicans TaxID=7291 RepID=A0A9C6T542_DROAB|nr:uncharacterized protein LOC117566716 [Drosophila albomicans]